MTCYQNWWCKYLLDIPGVWVYILLKYINSYCLSFTLANRAIVWDGDTSWMSSGARSGWHFCKAMLSPNHITQTREFTQYSNKQSPSSCWLNQRDEKRPSLLPSPSSPLFLLWCLSHHHPFHHHFLHHTLLHCHPLLLLSLLLYLLLLFLLRELSETYSTYCSTAVGGEREWFFCLWKACEEPGIWRTPPRAPKLFLQHSLVRNAQPSCFRSVDFEVFFEFPFIFVLSLFT